MIFRKAVLFLAVVAATSTVSAHAQFGVYGEAVISLITVQNTRGVDRVEFLAPDLIADQIRAVLDDIPPAAAKTGALGNCGIIEAVAALAAGRILKCAAACGRCAPPPSTRPSIRSGAVIV